MGLILQLGFNATVDSEYCSNWKTMISRGCDVLSDTKDVLIEFCEITDLVIGGNLFPHRDII